MSNISFGGRMPACMPYLGLFFFLVFAIIGQSYRALGGFLPCKSLLLTVMKTLPT